MIWKLLIGVISDKAYDHLEKNKLSLEKQKGSRRKCQGRKDQLAIERWILQNCQKRNKNLSIARVEYKKALDMVPNSLIIATTGMVGLTDNMIDFIKQSMNKWKTNLMLMENYLDHCPLKEEYNTR